MLKISILLASMAMVLARPDPSTMDPLSDEYINYLNSLNLSWKAGRNFHKSSSMEDIQALCGSIIRDDRTSLPTKYSVVSKELPEEFDSRKQWPKCKTIQEIRDQSSCGSCWAFGAVEAISDRICIASNQTINVEISAQDLLTCCKDCGMGCLGGFPEEAWVYWVDNGLVSGGLYGDEKTCQPYSFEPCSHFVENSQLKPCGNPANNTPSCQNQCQSAYKTKTFTQDKHYGETAYHVIGVEDHIKEEIMTHGPVEGTLIVYEDFLHYKSGVYEHSKDSKIVGGHGVKIIGWGVENNVPYWICANSWNEEWGDKGFFKIFRGYDECGIETSIVAGTPKL